MRRPAIIFDRDNTLIVSDGYLGDREAVRLVSGAADAVARARQLGYVCVVVSNQSGVARGMFTEDAVRAVNARLDELLRRENPAAIIDRHEFCPYHPEAAVEKYRRDSDLRKPRPGMILKAAEALALDLPRSWVVGDAPRDVEAGRAAGCRTILFRDPALPSSPAANEAPAVEPDYTCSTLAEAIDYIAKHPPPPSGDPDSNGDGIGTDADDTDESPPPRRMPSLGPTSERVEPREPGPQQPPTPSGTNPSIGPELEKIRGLLESVLQEQRRRATRPDESAGDFSVSKLLAGILQVVVLAVLFVAYLRRGDEMALLNTLVFALVLQAMTIALLIMSRQR